MGLYRVAEYRRRAQVGAESGAAAAAWFSEALGVACWLVQQRPGSRASALRGPAGPRAQAPAESAERGAGVPAEAPPRAQAHTEGTASIGAHVCHAGQHSQACRMLRGGIVCKSLTQVSSPCTGG